MAQNPQYQQYYAGYTGAAAGTTAATGYAYPQTYGQATTTAAYNAWPYYSPGTAGTTTTVTDYSQSPANSTSASKYPPISLDTSNAPWKKSSSGTPKASASSSSYTTTSGASNASQPQYLAIQPRTVTQTQNGVGTNTPKQKANSLSGSGASGGSGQDTFSPGLRDYVARIMKLTSAQNRDYAESQVRDLLTKVVAMGTAWSTDWSSLPLPEYASPDFVPPKPISPSPARNSKKRKNPLHESDDDTSSSVSASKQLRSDEIAKRNERLKRFETTAPTVVKKPIHTRLKEPEPNPDVIDWDRYTIVGTSTVLEKPYLRLTSAPDPANVRPLPILRQALKLLKKKWREEQNYVYICDQFKSLRQDLTVQRIRNAFTIEVYETHARIALEKGDLGEFNQCQSQLKHLYKEVKDAGHENEFKAYRVLYCLHTLNRRDINNLLQDLTASDRKDPQISHALAVRKAVAHRDYHQLFKLYRNYPANMSPYLIDQFVDRERIGALKIMCVAYKSSTLHVRFVAEELGWTGPGGVDECVRQLREWKIPLVDAEVAADDMELEDAGPNLKVETKEAMRIVLAMWASKFKVVDIKGQQ